MRPVADVTFKETARLSLLLLDNLPFCVVYSSDWTDAGCWWQAGRCIRPRSPRSEDTEPANVSISYTRTPVVYRAVLSGFVFPWRHVQVWSCGR